MNKIRDFLRSNMNVYIIITELSKKAHVPMSTLATWKKEIRESVEKERPSAAGYSEYCSQPVVNALVHFQGASLAAREGIHRCPRGSGRQRPVGLKFYLCTVILRRAGIVPARRDHPPSACELARPPRRAPFIHVQRTQSQAWAAPPRHPAILPVSPVTRDARWRLAGLSRATGSLWPTPRPRHQAAPLFSQTESSRPGGPARPLLSPRQRLTSPLPTSPER
jgi:hypothetical protein